MTDPEDIIASAVRAVLGNPPPLMPGADSYDMTDLFSASIAARLAAAGYAIVPKTPTREMLEAAFMRIDFSRTEEQVSWSPVFSEFLADGWTSCEQDLREAYDALLAAAPPREPSNARGE